jgi:hypothetical protein
MRAASSAVRKYVGELDLMGAESRWAAEAPWRAWEGEVGFGGSTGLERDGLWAVEAALMAWEGELVSEALS